MNYDEFGLHQLRKDPDFRRLEELEDKANATAGKLRVLSRKNMRSGKS